MGGIKKITNPIKKTVDKVKDTVQDTLDKAEDTVKDTIEAGAGIIGGVVGGITSGLGDEGDTSTTADSNNDNSSTNNSVNNSNNTDDHSTNTWDYSNNTTTNVDYGDLAKSNENVAITNAKAAIAKQSSINQTKANIQASINRNNLEMQNSFLEFEQTKLKTNTQLKLREFNQQVEEFIQDKEIQNKALLVAGGIGLVLLMKKTKG